MLTPDMFFDFSACGGILTFAAGMRVAKIKSIPLINLIPALVLVMPFSRIVDNCDVIKYRQRKQEDEEPMPQPI